MPGITVQTIEEGTGSTLKRVGIDANGRKILLVVLLI